jgi:hypothetical protein
MDIYTTTALNRLVQSLIRPQTALLSAFFGTVETSDTEDIKFDVETKKRRITPFVSPLREGKLVEDEGYTTNSFSPAYTKDKRVFNPDRAFKRSAGETIGGSMAPMDRQRANLARASADQLAMLARRKEVMASEVLRTGKVTVAGEGYPTTVVDFRRKATHTVALAGAARWGEAGTKPLTNLEDWSLIVLQDSGAAIKDVVMDTDAWRYFRDDPQVEKKLDTRPLSASTDSIVAVHWAKVGLSLKGSIGEQRFWVYQDWYVDDAGVTKPMLPQYTVILASPDLEGVQHHGAIQDEDAGLQPLEYFSKSWTEQDPSRRLLLMQSAPLVVPYRPDASFCATVR